MLPQQNIFVIWWLCTLYRIARVIIRNILTVFLVLPRESRKLNTFNWRYVRQKRCNFLKKERKEKREGDGQEPTKCLKWREDTKIWVCCLFIKFLKMKDSKSSRFFARDRWLSIGLYFLHRKECCREGQGDKIIEAAANSNLCFRLILLEKYLCIGYQ